MDKALDEELYRNKSPARNLHYEWLLLMREFWCLFLVLDAGLVDGCFVESADWN
jgi:hypothetical protein